MFLRTSFFVFVYLFAQGFKCHRPGLFVFSFDDGISANYDRVLEILDYERIKAVFFVRGETLASRKNEKILKAATEKGHAIGNHTWSHPKLTELDDVQIISEIESAQNGIQQAYKGKKYVRAPFGALDDRVCRILSSLGYQIVGWNLDAKDWSRKRSKDDMLKYYDKNIRDPDKNSFMSLQHDKRTASVEIISEIAHMARNRGFEIVSLETCISG